MDPITFDTLVRTFSARGTRRQLVTVLAALPLVGVLTGLPADGVSAEHPRDRLQRRTAHRNRKRHNANNRDKNTRHNTRNTQGGGPSDGYPNGCGDVICPPDKPLCCEVIVNGSIVLECFRGSTCPDPSA